jgi:O-antigen ligase
MASTATDGYSNRLDEYFVLALILTIPTIPFFRYSMGGFEIPLVAPITVVYAILRFVTVLFDRDSIDLKTTVSGVLLLFLIWSMVSLLWCSSLDPAVRRLIARFSQICFVLLVINCCNLDLLSLHRLTIAFVIMAMIPALVGYHGFFTEEEPLHYQFSYEYPRQLGDRNSDTFFILTALPLALAMFLGRSFRTVWRMVGLATFILMAGAIFFSLSRANLLVMTVIVSVLILGDLAVRRVPLGSIVKMASVCLCFFLLSTVVPTDIFNRTVGELEKRFEEVQTDRRWDLLFASWELAARHPLRGVGLNNFSEQFRTTDTGRYEAQEEDYEPNPHNSFLGTWAELGLPGLFVFSMVVFWPLAYLARLTRRVIRSRDSVAISLFLGSVGLSLVLVQGILAYHFADIFYFWVAYAFNSLLVLGLDRSLRRGATTTDLVDIMQFDGHLHPEKT